MEKKAVKTKNAGISQKAVRTKSGTAKSTKRASLHRPEAETMVQEPAVGYALIAKNSHYDEGLVHWLGTGYSDRPIKSTFDLIQLGHKGITKSAIEHLARHMGLTRKAIAEEIFDLSVKTLERKASTDLLDKKTSSHALEIARVMDHALTVFEDEEKVKRWINKPNRALNNIAPVQLFDTLSGLNLVNDVLGRIEEGVYS